MISEGTHRGVATHYQWGKTAKGGEQVVVGFRVTEGDFRGASLTYFGYFTEKTTERTLDTLRYCGWKGDDLSDLGELNQEVDLVIKHEEYEGKVRARIAWVNRPGGGQIKLKEPMAPDELKHFAAQMRESARATPEVDGVVSESEAPADPAPSSRGSSDLDPPLQDDDDIGWM